MADALSRVVILGGGTAGWLSAAYLAARRPDLSITLIEAPDIPTIGVGEGTWPTMRGTLAEIGISEAEFLRACDASFKQGSRFEGWVNGRDNDAYLHPFTAPPQGEAMAALLAAWQESAPDQRFDEAVSAQGAVCDKGLAPRKPAMPDYAGAVNYAYHLDAGKFAELLRTHATEVLGVTWLQGHVEAVDADEQGDITALRTREGEVIAGDLFLDCSGQAAVLIGGHYQQPWLDRSDVSPNNRALACQVPTEPGSPIASVTIGHAHEAGWIWDIALPKRRGIGCVYSADFASDARAEEILHDYVMRRVPGANWDALSPRLLKFPTGYRQEIWHRNCIAIGQSAGFIEPLEASAIVMIELSVRAIADNFPRSRAAMAVHARRFNALFHYRWERVIDFLKLHYALSERSEPYWLAQRDPGSFSERLKDQLLIWREQPPSSWDLPQVDEIFSAASQQYVLYGMGYPLPAAMPAPAPQSALDKLAKLRQQARNLTSVLPSGRAYMDQFAVRYAAAE